MIENVDHRIKILSFDPFTLELPDVDVKAHLGGRWSIEMPPTKFTVKKAPGAEILDGIVPDDQIPSIVADIPFEWIFTMPDLDDMKDKKPFTLARAVETVLNARDALREGDRAVQDVADNHGPLLPGG